MTKIKTLQTWAGNAEFKYYGSVAAGTIIPIYGYQRIIISDLPEQLLGNRPDDDFLQATYVTHDILTSLHIPYSLLYEFYLSSFQK